MVPKTRAPARPNVPKNFTTEADDTLRNPKCRSYIRNTDSAVTPHHRPNVPGENKTKG